MSVIKQVAKQQRSVYATMAEMFDPLVNALNDSPANMKGEEADSGSLPPAATDMGLKILLGMLAGTIHTQLYGMIQTKTGTKIDNAAERATAAEDRIRKLSEEDDCAFETKQGQTALHWYEVNTARRDAYAELLQAFTTVYADIFREEWKPMVRAVREQDKTVMSPSQKESLIRVLGKTKFDAMYGDNEHVKVPVTPEAKQTLIKKDAPNAPKTPF